MTSQSRDNVELAPLTTFGVGGPARYFVDASNENATVEAFEWAKRYRVAVHVLGGGSNVLVSDAGVDGLVVRIALRGTRVARLGPTVEITAAAGEPWDELVAYCVEHGFAGLECLSGIPGSVGATPIQNVGAYGQDVSETIVRVRALDRHSGAIVELSRDDCAFAYRDSAFKSTARERYVVLDVTYRLRRDAAPTVRYGELERALARRGTGAPTLRDVRECVLAVRREKSMVLEAGDSNCRSAGSFFLNPVLDSAELAALRSRAGANDVPVFPQPDGSAKVPAAWLIERAGFSKGYVLGRAGISTRHSLALIALPGARAADVVALARRVRAEVEARLGVTLVPEPACWGFASLDRGLPDERLA